MNDYQQAIPIQLVSDALTEQEVTAIENECQHYEFREAAGIEALKLVQKNRGWISDELLSAIAEQINMSVAQLEGVATFYNHIYRKPVGKYVIHLCDSIACHLLRYQAIAEHLQRELNIQFGETTSDGLFTLLTNPCLGACDKGPALLVNEQIVEQLDCEKVDALIAKLRRDAAHAS